MKSQPAGVTKNSCKASPTLRRPPLRNAVIRPVVVRHRRANHLLVWRVHMLRYALNLSHRTATLSPTELLTSSFRTSHLTVAACSSHICQVPRTARHVSDLEKRATTVFKPFCDCRDGTITHETLKRNLCPVSQRVDPLLLRAFGTVAHGMSRQLYEHRAHLWTSLEDSNVTPTNNSGEHNRRHGMIWRKLSFRDSQGARRPLRRNPADRH